MFLTNIKGILFFYGSRPKFSIEVLIYIFGIFVFIIINN